MKKPIHQVIIVGGGVAGLSAAIYLARAQRDVLVIDTQKSLALWEPRVENYFGFPEGISGKDLLKRGLRQAHCWGAHTHKDEIVNARRKRGLFVLRGRRRQYVARRVLLATGLFHLLPKIDGVSECLGGSIFFCKDCDGCRVRKKRILIYGSNNEAMDYALGMLCYSASVGIVTDGKPPNWNRQHAWAKEYRIPVFTSRIRGVRRQGKQIKHLIFTDGQIMRVDALFTTRGDIFHNKLARTMGAKTNAAGEVQVDDQLRTSVPGLFAAGCVTPANCQMIIAAGQGATAAQAINRDLFEESLATHCLDGSRQDRRKRRCHESRLTFQNIIA